ncbi:low choriolytic enzyme-like [Hippocampus zosterae]|uniref:low choriolytic enzyme-like n=1 Tax=Hippocampus zosterae TaxID=109293 RepID=UPI00223E831D|nr:low choriolytic enzyme-like [Hippocampus zosterae]
MTPIFPLIVQLLLMLLSPTVSVTGDDIENLDVNERIARANANTTTPLIHGDIAINLQRNADACIAAGCKWPKTGGYVYVPVIISSGFSSQESLIIMNSLISFYEKTCIRFMWKRHWHRDFLFFFPGSGCWSHLGRLPGGQAISLQKFSCMNFGIVQHEVLHALGFHHEQVRSDRDDHVFINFENIKRGMEHNFEKEETNNLGSPYDFNSIMHYNNFAFSKNKRPTIIARGNPSLVFGLAREMSSNDIARVNALYGCD